MHVCEGKAGEREVPDLVCAEGGRAGLRAARGHRRGEEQDGAHRLRLSHGARPPARGAGALSAHALYPHHTASLTDPRLTSRLSARSPYMSFSSLPTYPPVTYTFSLSSPFSFFLLFEARLSTVLTAYFVLDSSSNAA